MFLGGDQSSVLIQSASPPQIGPVASLAATPQEHICTDFVWLHERCASAAGSFS